MDIWNLGGKTSAAEGGKTVKNLQKAAKSGMFGKTVKKIDARRRATEAALKMLDQ